MLYKFNINEIMLCKSLIPECFIRNCDLHKTLKKSDSKETWIKTMNYSRGKEAITSQKQHISFSKVSDSVLKYDLINNLTVVADIERNKCLPHL